MESIRHLALGIWVIAALSASHAQAALVQWEIDTAQSSVKLAIPDHKINISGTLSTIRFRNQNNATWTTNVAPLAGLINTDYREGDRIQFLNNPLGQIVGVNTGNYRPNPAAFDPGNTNAENPNGQFTNSSSLPGVLGFKVRAPGPGLITLELAYGNVHDVSFDVSSTARPINESGQFGVASEMSFGITQATLATEGLTSIAGQPVPDSIRTIAWSGTNVAALGSITTPNPITQPLLRRLQLPINVPLTVELAGFTSNATLSGTIVAFAMVPEPSSMLLAAGGLVGLGILAARRRGHRLR